MILEKTCYINSLTGNKITLVSPYNQTNNYSKSIHFLKLFLPPPLPFFSCTCNAHDKHTRILKSPPSTLKNLSKSLPINLSA